MSETLQRCVSIELQEMARIIETSSSVLSPESSFARYVLNRSSCTKSDFAITESDIKRLDQAPILAAIGYYIAIKGKATEDELKKLWCEAFARLRGRDAFPGDRNSYFFRPLDLLGICAGAAYAFQDRISEYDWLADIIKRGADRVQLGSSDLWADIIYSCSSKLVGVARPLGLPSVDNLRLEDMALAIWAQDKFGAVFKGFGTEQLEQFYEPFFSRCLKEEKRSNDLAAVTLEYSVLQQVFRKVVEDHFAEFQAGPKDRRDAVRLIRTICKRFHSYVLQLNQRQRGRNGIAVKDEYDVQDLLHSLLKIHFSDIRSEEPAPSHSGNSYRLDLYLPDQQVVIETKKTRKTLTDKKVCEELIIDKSAYQKHPGCRTLVCFVYDPERLLKNPAAIVADISQQSPDLDTAVIICPDE